MRTIKISNEVFEGLKKLAEPFVDTPDDVIRRLLKEKGVISASTDHKVVASSKPETKLLTQREYAQWLLHVLYTEFQGKAARSEVIEATLNAMAKHDLFSEGDFDTVSSGETRAQNKIAWARNRLKEDGYLKKDSSRGTWELTDAGIERAKKVASELDILTEE